MNFNWKVKKQQNWDRKIMKFQKGIRITRLQLNKVITCIIVVYSTLTKK